MPTNIVDVDEFTDPVQTVAHGEDATEANFALSAQDLANRSRNLKNRIDAVEARTVTAGAGLTGGGALSASLTINAVANADASIVVNANDIQVGVLATDAQHGARGGGTQHSVAVASGAAGFMSGADKAKLDGLPSSAAPTTRLITSGAGLTGGGDLSADRTIAVGANADGSIVVNADDVQVGVLATDGQHGTRGGGTLHAAAVDGGASGFMTGAMVTKLNASAAKWLIPAVQTTSFTAALDSVHRVDSSGGAVTVTLPTAVGNAGRGIVIKKWDTGTVNDVTLDGNASETIDGAATAVIAASTSATILGSLTVYSDGANWLIASRVGS